MNVLVDRVIGLCCLDGSLKENSTEIKDMLGIHFHNNFSPYTLTNLLMVASSFVYKIIPYKVSIGDKDSLDSDFMKENPFSSLFYLDYKVLGKDGFPCKFYKALWV